MAKRRAHNAHPVGAERKRAGFWQIKSEEGWQKKHHYTWKKHYGAIPPGYVVRFIDGNRDNCNIENLECVSRKEHSRKNGQTHALPAGTEKFWDGYWWICMGKGKWCKKHRYIWEKEYGPIPQGYAIKFIDGNRGNCQIDNLACIDSVLKPTLPIGTKRKKIGYWRIKTAPGTWELIHHVEWKKYCGNIPEGYVVRFIDGNQDNYAIDNLECISANEARPRNDRFHSRPLGSEHQGNSDYVYIKTGFPGKWEQKHRYLWEKHHGPIPKGHAVVFADGNKKNFAITNLECIPIGEQMRRVGEEYYSLPDILKPTSALRIKLLTAIAKRKRELKASAQKEQS